MTAHVAQRAGAEIPPAPPLAGHILGMIGPVRGRAQPQIPVQRRRDRRRVGRPRAAAPVLAAPEIDPADLADDAGLDPLHKGLHLAGGVELRAHLGHDALLAGHFGELANLVDIMAQGLLAVDVLAHFDSHHRRHRVQVVRRRDRHSVDVLVLGLQHLAEVLVLLRARGACRSWPPCACSNRRRTGRRCSPCSPTARRWLPWPPTPMQAMLSFSLGGTLPSAAQNVTGHNRERCHGRGTAQELASIHPSGLHCTSPLN